MQTLAELRERRAYECRLTAGRAIETLDEAEGFLTERGLLTRMTDSALPSLFEALHEEPSEPGRPGFGKWPATKYGWFGKLGARGYPILSVHRGKNVLMTEATAMLLDPICRAEINRMERADPQWARLLQHLAQTGPSELKNLQIDLGLKPAELKKLRAPLERSGAIVSRTLVYEHPHRHTSELARWDQIQRAAGKKTDPRRALGDVLVTAVRAAVVAPEPELRRWFSWPWYWDDLIVDELVHDGRLMRVDDHIAAAE